MATQRQIEANRQNSARSTGPKSASGKAKSRLNAIKHAMAGESAVVEAGASGEFAERRAKWAPEYQRVGEAGNWALDQAVASSLRIERCGRTLEVLAVAERARARLAWDQDRAVEAATVLGRLSKDPVLASRQLETTLAGVMLLIDAWFGLLEAFEAGGDWSEAEASKALDLLGVSPDRRSRRTPIAPPDGGDPVAFHKALALDELDRLEALRDESLAPLDEMDRQVAMDGDLALLSNPAKLVLRYERDAWRRYRESIRELHARDSAKAPAAPPVVKAQAVEAGPPPIADRPPTGRRPVPAGRNEPNPPASFEEERRSLLAQAATVLAGYPDRPAPIALDDESDWLDDLERRMDGPGQDPARATTERTQSRRIPLNQ